MGGRYQMELHNHRAPSGSSPSFSSAGSSSVVVSAATNNNNGGQAPPPSDPMHSWWESISKARSRIETLASLLPQSLSPTLSALADSDRPALSLLSSAAAYSAVSSSLSGSSSDPLCHWLYDTFLSSDPHLRLLVSSFLPLVSSLYLSLLHSPESAAAHSLAGFEAVLLAVYSAECKSRAGKPILVHVPDLSYPSLYHNPRSSSVSAGALAGTGVLSPPLEPQTAVKSTKRACIVGVALDYYYKHITQMPPWSKTELCRAVASWTGGGDCPCVGELDRNNDDEEDAEEEISDGLAELRIENVGSVMRGSRVPLPWELLQPALRILGHCLLAPLSPPEVKDEAAVAVRRLYARASHDLAPQAILATRSLIQLDNRTKADERNIAATSMTGNSSSNVNTPSKAKKPEILLVSK